MAPATLSDDLSSSIEVAEEKATVLDDRMEIEDATVFAWLKAQELHRGMNGHIVLGRQSLPAAWKPMAFPVEADASRFLRQFAHDHKAMRTMRELGRSLYQTPVAASDDVLLRRLAAALVSGTVWAIHAVKRKSRFVTKTDPKAFAPINPRYNTKIDFAFIAGVEGDQWLRGYVPMRKGVVIGRSGMTVATGFDLGQWSARQLDGFHFPPDLTAKLRPFADHPFKNKTKSEVVAEVVKLGTVPELTKVEADLCDSVVFDQILHDAKSAWDRTKGKHVPAFIALPPGWQTVWLSRHYQEGQSTHVPEGKVFRKAALEGHWNIAITTLKGYSQYKGRAAGEALLLEKELPPSPAEKPAAASSKSQ